MKHILTILLAMTAALATAETIERTVSDDVKATQREQRSMKCSDSDELKYSKTPQVLLACGTQDNADRIDALEADSSSNIAQFFGNMTLMTLTNEDGVTGVAHVPRLANDFVTFKGTYKSKTITFGITDYGLDDGKHGYGYANPHFEAYTFSAVYGSSDCDNKSLVAVSWWEDTDLILRIGYGDHNGSKLKKKYVHVLEVDRTATPNITRVYYAYQDDGNGGYSCNPLKQVFDLAYYPVTLIDSFTYPDGTWLTWSQFTGSDAQ